MAKKGAKRRNYYTTADVAELLMVCPAAVRGILLKAEFKFPRTPGGHRRFTAQDIEDIKEMVKRGKKA